MSAGDPGLPPGIAAIMAAIRGELTAPPAVPATTAAHAVDAAGVRAEERDAAGAEPAAEARAADFARAAGLDPAVRELLAPLLKAWLDAHLPEIVEAAVHAELRRLTGHEVDASAAMATDAAAGVDNAARLA